jgi:hypothetical protein
VAGDGERTPEAEMDVHEAVSEGPDIANQPPEALPLLLLAPLFGRVGVDILYMVIDDRQRNQIHVLALAARIRVGHVREHPIPWGKELAGPRAAAFQVPLEREPLLDQVVEIALKDQLVEGVVLEGPSDEEHTSSPYHRTDREEVHVDPACGVIGRGVVLPEDVLQ